MTDIRAPKQSSYTRAQHVAVATLMSFLTLGFVAYQGKQVYDITMSIGKQLINAPVQTKNGATTWGKALNAKSPAMAAFKCQMNTECSPWFNRSFEQRWNMDATVIPLMALAAISVISWRRVPSKLSRKDPGQGKWAGLDDPQIIDIADIKVNDAAAKEEIRRMDKFSPRSFYLGHMVPWTEQDGFLWRKPTVINLRERARHEHILVTGAPGSGKTRGMFRQNIAKDALEGRIAVVFDLKWPQTDSGFRDLILFYHLLGRPVYVFAPFSPNSMRLPLLEGIDNLNEALTLAKTIIPTPEYKEETGAFYKDVERRALAAMILAIAQSPTPTMLELQRLGQMNVAEFEAWYKRQQNPEIKQALKAMFDMKTEQISGTLSGVLSKLSIFYNPNVSRATSAGDNPDEIIKFDRLAKEGGLFIIGMETRYFQDGDAEILTQMVKRRTDKELLAIADRKENNGAMPRTVTYYLDELPGLGRLPYLMSNLAQLRSKKIAMMLGVQNSEQGNVVYSRDVWKATTQGTTGTRIEFIQGASKEDAKALSEEIGQQTVYESGQSTSGHRLWSAPWSAEARKSESLKTTKIALLSTEEIKRFPRDLAAVFVKGQNPVLVATPSLDSPFIIIRTPTGRRVKIKNQLYGMWQKVMGNIKNIPEECDRLVEKLSVQGINPDKPEVIKAAPEYWQEWLAALLNEGAMARVQKTDEKMKVMIRKDTLPEKLKLERDINYFIGCGWLNLSQNEDEYTITQEGLNVAGKLIKASLRDFIVRGPALYWARKHKEQVKGYPGSKAGDTNPIAIYTPEILSVPSEAAQEMYGIIPDLPSIEVDHKTYLQIPLSDPKALSEAITRAAEKANNQDPLSANRKKQVVRKGHGGLPLTSTDAQKDELDRLPESMIQPYVETKAEDGKEVAELEDLDVPAPLQAIGSSAAPSEKSPTNSMSGTGDETTPTQSETEQDVTLETSDEEEIILPSDIEKEKPQHQPKKQSAEEALDYF